MTRKLQIRVASLILAALLNCSWPIEASGDPVRLAIVTTVDAYKSGADLLTAGLSRQNDLLLLEREKVDAVLREQALSAGGLISKNYLKLGQILGVDGLLILGEGSSAQAKRISVRLVAVRTGVVLQMREYPWPLPEATGWADLVWQQFRALFPKLKIDTQDAIPLSVLNLRSTFPSRQARQSEDELTRLSIYCLSREPEIFVLERSRLQDIAFEKELQPEEQSPFWTGRYLLEGTLDPNGFDPNRITVQARLTPPKGGTPTLLEVAGERDNLGGVAQELVKKVLAALKRPAVVTNWQAQAESEHYRQEAVWARRWGLHRQAEEASESAWALGQHTRAVALLRIQSYLDDDWGIRPSRYLRMNYAYFYPNDEFAPNAAHLRLGLRALELFCQDAPLLRTNRTGIDSEWFGLGVSLLNKVGGLLETFYYVAEARQGCGEQLAAMRADTRRFVAVLDSLSSKDPSLIRRSRADDPGSSAVNPITLKWSDGALWYEKPDEALEVHRQMVEAGLHPFDLPFAAAWSWEDRKRVPGLLKKFVTDLSHSTNSDVRLEGLYLAMALSPRDPEGSLEDKEKELLDAIWSNRDRFFSGEAESSLLPRTEWMLKRKYSYDANENPASFGLPSLREEPFLSFQDRLRKDFLARTPRWEGPIFGALFTTDPAKYEEAQAREFIPLLEEFRKRLALKPPQDSAPGSVLQVLKSRISSSKPAPSSAKPAPVANPTVTQQLQVVAFTETNLKLPGLETWPKPAVENAMFRFGKLWLQLRYSQRGAPFNVYHTVYLGADIKTDKFEAIPFPAEFGHPDPTTPWSKTRFFEVTKDSLFVSAQDRLQRYRFQEKRWETISVPMDGGGIIRELNGRIFLTTRESFSELLPDSKTIKLLASSRRKSPTNPLDQLSFVGGVFPGPNKSVGVLANGRVFTCTAPITNYTEVEASLLPTGPGQVSKTAFISDQGLLWLVGGQTSPTRLFALWNGRERLEPLLEQAARLGGTAPTASSSPCRWKWPEPYVLHECSFVADGEGVCALSGHARTGMPGSPRVVSTSFNDERNATMLRFEPNRDDPVCTPLKFEKEGRQTDPFAIVEGDMPWRLLCPPFWLSSPDGFILAGPTGAGYWLIPKTPYRDGERPREAQSNSTRRISTAIPSDVGSNSTGALKP